MQRCESTGLDSCTVASVKKEKVNSVEPGEAVESGKPQIAIGALSDAPEGALR
jgi:hypothetical protein